MSGLPLFRTKGGLPHPSLKSLSSKRTYVLHHHVDPVCSMPLSSGASSRFQPEAYLVSVAGPEPQRLTPPYPTPEGSTFGNACARTRHVIMVRAVRLSGVVSLALR